MNWTTEWPTRPGHYWLYGWRFRDRGKPARFHHVEVQKLQRGLVYLTNGYCLYKVQGAGGIWQPVEFPELPPVREETCQSEFNESD